MSPSPGSTGLRKTPRSCASALPPRSCSTNSGISTSHTARTASRGSTGSGTSPTGFQRRRTRARRRATGTSKNCANASGKKYRTGTSPTNSARSTTPKRANTCTKTPSTRRSSRRASICPKARRSHTTSSRTRGRTGTETASTAPCICSCKTCFCAAAKSTKSGCNCTCFPKGSGRTFCGGKPFGPNLCSRFSTCTRSSGCRCKSPKSPYPGCPTDPRARKTRRLSPKNFTACGSAIRTSAR